MSDEVKKDDDKAIIGRREAGNGRRRDKVKEERRAEDQRIRANQSRPSVRLSVTKAADGSNGATLTRMGPCV